MQVEATVSKAALWVVGTAVGGTLGYAAMVSSVLATNPYGLMAILMAFTAIVGCLGGTTASMSMSIMLSAASQTCWHA